MIAVGTGDGRVFVWNRLTKGARFEPLPARLSHEADELALSPSSRYLAASVSRWVLVWDLRQPSAKPVQLEHPVSVVALSFTSDDELVTSSKDRRLRWWHRRGAREPRLSVEAQLSTIAVTGEGQVATADGDAIVVRGSDGRVIERIDHGAFVRQVGAADGGMLVSSGEDGMIRLWQRKRGAQATESARVRAAASRVDPYVFAVSPDGRYLIRTSSDGLRAELLAPRDLVAFACGRLATTSSRRDPLYRHACRGR